MKAEIFDENFWYAHKRPFPKHHLHEGGTAAQEDRNGKGYPEGFRT